MHAKPTRLCIAYTVYDTALKPMITSPVYRLNALLTTTYLLTFMKQFPHFHSLVECKKLCKFPVATYNYNLLTREPIGFDNSTYK